MTRLLRGPVPALLLLVALFGSVAAAPAPTSATTTTGPVLTELSVKFRPGAAMTWNTYQVVVRWKASSGSPVRYTVQRSVDGAAFATLSNPTVLYANSSVVAGHAYRYRVRGYTSAGTAGAWVTTESRVPGGSDQTSPRFTWTGTWAQAANSANWGGSAKYSTTAGARVDYALDGYSAALVGTLGPTRGSVRIYVDGVWWRTISLYRATTAYRQVIWEITWPTSGKRTISFVVVGTANHPRVDIDGVLYLK